MPQKDWDPSTMECKEIGDGNLNYVFKVKDAKGHSVIVKQAGVELRISKEMKIDTDRNRGGVRDPDAVRKTGPRPGTGDLQLRHRHVRLLHGGCFRITK